MLEQLIEDRWRQRKDHPASIRLRHIVAAAYERGGEPWESIRMYEQLMSGLRTRLSPESPPMGEVKEGLARGQAAEAALGIPRPPSRAEQLLGISHRDQPTAVPADPRTEEPSDGQNGIDHLIELSRANASFGQQRQALQALLVERGLSSATVATVIEHVKEGVVLRHSNSGRCRLGGSGFLPPGAAWPRSPNGYPMTPLAVLELVDLPNVAPLPADGTLLLYWDAVDPVTPDALAPGRVFWVPSAAEAIQVPAPSDRSVEFEPISVSGYRTAIAGDPPIVVSQIEEDQQRDLLIDVMDEIADELYGHQLLGAPREIQGPLFDELAHQLEHGPAETRARFNEAELLGRGWCLLAQIEEEGNMTFADGGALYFLIPEQDLAERLFDRTAVILQSH